MRRAPKYDLLFEPVRVGPKLMRNRFYQTAHCTSFGSDMPETQALFRGTKAEGGWAVVSTEYCAISPDTDDSHRVSARLWDDGDVENLAEMCARAHEHGALAAVELWHGGPSAARQESRLPALGASAGGHPFVLMSAAKEMDHDDIARVQQDYVAAALRARDAGFDIVTLHLTGGGSLPHQFLLPLFNRRSDDYGGSFENRARFALETLHLIREGVGDDTAVTARFGIDSLPAPHGYGPLGIATADEGIRFIELADELVDLWDINIGASEWGEDAGPSRTHRENHQRPYVLPVKQHTDKPVMGVGRFTNADTMVDAIRTRQIDIIGAARPSIADPFLPKKIEDGELDEIRECIGCNICISRWETGGPPIICTQNATAGEEYRRGWHPELFDSAANADRTVLVVGAGPAGMECAMVLGKRGMRRVHLVEAENELGGCLRWITKLPGLGEWGRVINYRQIQLAKLRNVEVITGKRLELDDVLEYGADIVVVATGSSWAESATNPLTHEPLSGVDATRPHVFTPEQLLLDGKPLVDRQTVVYDAEGYYVGASIAEWLARRGQKVTVVTPLRELAPYMELTLELPRIRRMLAEFGVTVVCDRELEQMHDGTVRFADVWGGDTLEVAAESLVLVAKRTSHATLYRRLRADPTRLRSEGIESVYAVGDCVVPQLLADAIFDAHRLGREIDTKHPELARTYLRERKLMSQARALSQH